MQECKDLLIDAQNTASAVAEAGAQAVIDKLSATARTLVLAESCTAGLISSLLAEVPGASKVLRGSFVCYTKEAKVFMLGLTPAALEEHGLVSEQTAYAMASGALQKSGADLAAAVTGLAGPEGDGSGVPVGTVWIAAARRGGEPLVKRYNFSGSRNEVRLSAAIAVLEEIINLS